MKIHRRISGFVILTALFFLAGCGGQRPESFDKPMVILITLDTLRSDRLPSYGYQVIDTPNLSAFEKDAVLYERAYAQVPLTLPSHASMFTGLLPPDHGVRDNIGYVLKEENETLAERFKAVGYQTGAVVSSMVLRSSTGIAAGFDFYQDDMVEGLPGSETFAERRGDKSIELANAWLAGHDRNRPVFFWLHLYDPHAPYSPPEPFLSQTKDPYDAEIVYVDHLLGILFKQLKDLGMYDDSLIVVTSDHGEGLGDHGEEQHGLLVYREAIQVPLLIKLPGAVRGGTRVVEAVGLHDLGTTLPALAGVGEFGGGRVLGTGDVPVPDKREIYSESLNPMLRFGWYPVQSVVRGDLHYLRSDEGRLFDVVADPAETNNLLGGAEVPKSVISFIEKRKVGKQEQAEVSQEDMALLASLGYTGGFAVDDKTRSLNEKRLMELFKIIGESKIRIEMEAYAEAEQVLTRVVQQFPGMVDARVLLGSALESQNKLDQADYVYTEALALDPGNISVLKALIGVKLGRKQVDAALKLVDRLVKEAPNIGPRQMLPILERHDLFEQAEQMARRVLAGNPGDAYAHYVVGRAAAARGDFQKAGTSFEEAVRLINPETQVDLQASILFGKGDALAREGLVQEALDAFQQSLALRPDHGKTRASLTIMLYSLGEPEKALQNLDGWLHDFPSPGNYARAAEVCRILGLEKQAKRYEESVSD